MKYRVMLLLVLMGAILVATIGGTLAGYTGEAAFSFSIQPETRVTQQAQQIVETPGTAATEPDTQATMEEMQTDTESASSSPQEANNEAAPDALQENE